MKVKEVMSANPACCMPNDTAQNAAKMMCDFNVGAVPVVADQQSRALVGMITDRDLCCSIVAHGLDPKTTKIQEFITYTPVTCRDGENVEKCERLMQEHQVRRIPVVDGEGRVIGIVAQADLALKDKAERVHKTVAEISKPTRPAIVAAVRTKEEADHSLPYILSVALLDDRVMPEQYRPERINRPDVQRLLNRVKVHPAEDLSHRFPQEMPCRLHVRLHDGRLLTREKSDY